MRRTGIAFFVAAAVCMLAAPAAQAAPITVSTGDLGNNVIWDGGYFEVSLAAANPSLSLPSTIEVKYGLWNSPKVVVSVFLNSTPVGSFLADRGYIGPGPSLATFDVTGLLQNGSNTVSFNGFQQSTGDYVIGRVDLNYDDPPAQPAPVPEPVSIILLGSGLAGAAFRKCRG